MKNLTMLLRDRKVIVAGFLIILIAGFFMPKPIVLIAVGVVFGGRSF